VIIYNFVVISLKYIFIFIVFDIETEMALSTAESELTSNDPDVVRWIIQHKTNVMVTNIRREILDFVDLISPSWFNDEQDFKLNSYSILALDAVQSIVSSYGKGFVTFQDETLVRACERYFVDDIQRIEIWLRVIEECAYLTHNLAYIGVQIPRTNSLVSGFDVRKVIITDELFNSVVWYVLDIRRAFVTYQCAISLGVITAEDMTEVECVLAYYDEIVVIKSEYDSYPTFWHVPRLKPFKIAKRRRERYVNVRKSRLQRLESEHALNRDSVQLLMYYEVKKKEYPDAPIVEHRKLDQAKSFVTAKQVLAAILVKVGQIEHAICFKKIYFRAIRRRMESDL